MSEQLPAPDTVRPRIALAAGLFFLAPVVAEFLLGNLPIKMLPALIVLAPMYGGGALLIREIVRRAGRGWPSIVLLGIAYGIVEEAFTTQSLFNPNYLHLNLHLLDPAFIPLLGIGAWWSFFVITLHAAWSISTSIALIEGLAAPASTAPWLGRAGLAITALLFALGVIANTLIGYKQDHFLASHAQLACAAIICVLLGVVAFRIPQRATTLLRKIPNPWLAAALTLIAGSVILIVPKEWGWWAAITVLAVDLLVSAAILFWSRSPAWNQRHKVALAGGAALAYAWHAFVETPALGHADLSVRIGNVIFAVGAVALIAAAEAKARSATLSRAST